VRILALLMPMLSRECCARWMTLDVFSPGRRLEMRCRDHSFGMRSIARTAIRGARHMARGHSLPYISAVSLTAVILRRHESQANDRMYADRMFNWSMMNRACTLIHAQVNC
jgi:hypothetical protein